MKIIRGTVMMVVMVTAALCAQIAGAAEARPPLVQSIDLHVPMPPAPVTISGRKFLAYELHLSNFRPFDIEVTRLEILDADRNARLADYRETEFAGRLGRAGVAFDKPDKRVLPPGSRAVVFLWLALDGASVPRALKHRIEFDLVRTSGREHGVVEDGAQEIRNEKPLVLGPPLSGGPWAALYDPMMAGGHRTSIYTLDGRARIPARYAIDFIRLNHDATHASADASQIASWHGYGAAVLAVADAPVAEARDDIAEHPSITSGSSGPIALENASGNYVTLDLGNGRYAFYEHLKRGSLAVKRGDRVRRGQVIGRLGNSGSSSSGPHLHFHVSDANATLAAEGQPYVFDRFEVVGAYETINGPTSGQAWHAPEQGSGDTRTNELPDANTVLMFAPPSAR